MATFLHKGVSYHVSIRGDNRKPPLILLHGFSQSSETWDPVFQELTKHRSVLAPDFIGHGRSEKPADARLYEMEVIRDWLTALTHWIGADRVDLLGYSMGGRIALSYAIDTPHKVASLILESTGLGPSTTQQHLAMVKRDKDMIEKLVTKSLEEFMDAWENLPVFESQKQLPFEVRKSLRMARMKNDARALALMVQGTGQHIMPAYSRDIRLLPMPILYIAGNLDRRYMKIAEKLQHNEGISCILLDAGHNTHLEASQAFVRRVNAFLQDSSHLSTEMPVNS